MSPEHIGFFGISLDRENPFALLNVTRWPMKLAGFLGLTIGMMLVSCATTETISNKPLNKSRAFACKKALRDNLGSMNSVRIYNYGDVERGRSKYLYYSVAEGAERSGRKLRFSCEQGLPQYMNYDATPERWRFRFDSRQWELVYQVGCYQEFCRYIPPNMMNRTTRWYVPKGQTADEWTEQLTSNFYTVPQSASLARWHQSSIAAISKGCPSLAMKPLLNTSDTIMFEFSHTGCNGYRAQYELQRIARTGSGVLVLSYTKMGNPPVGKDHDNWVAAISEARVRSDDEVQPELQRVRDDAKAQNASFMAICSVHYKLTPELSKSQAGRRRMALMTENWYILPDAQKACLRWAKGGSL
jgi:hypothetical protein